ncbi:GntR family transcriptional regulator [Chloroflexi bacterium TSY]|nr:GntR family transcriptional regulator [Chloroflexi bacterium TSY]
MNKENLAPIAPRTLKENVIDIIRRSIINGDLAPGAELNQAQIAEKLGVSRGPVREALGRLEQEGLIRVTAYKRVFITPLDRRYVEELYSVRTALETMALERSIDRVTSKDLEKLELIVDKMRIAARNHEQQTLVELDLSFHEQIVDMADHNLVMNLWQQLTAGVKRCLHTQHSIYTFLDEVVGTHPTIVTAIAERNKRLAVQILREHITESAETIIRGWKFSDEPGEVEYRNGSATKGSGIESAQ